MVVCWTMSYKRNVPSQGQPKWWLAGQGAIPQEIQRHQEFAVNGMKT